MNSSVDTVNAAASAIVSADSRVQQVAEPKRRWRTFFRVYWCFGSQRQTKRINHAVLFPEPISNGPNATVSSDSANHPPSLTLPFIAPPSSPASFMNSEPPSSAHTPGGFLSLTNLSANAYSPSGPASIFAIGPYAHETQLVSPPVFSTFTTEPSTAPFTPPPESVQLTTPSSPEVPFAQLLSSFDANCKKRDAYEFQSYQLYPGSPIGNLISPSSVCSGTSSPFPDLESHSAGAPRKVSTAEGFAEHRLIPRSSSRRHGSILDGHIPLVMHGSEEPTAANHRVSFELSAVEVARCMEKKPAKPGEAAALRPSLGETEAMYDYEQNQTKMQAESPERIESSGELVASREFKFSNSDGAMAVDPNVGSDWWVNEKVISADAIPSKNWAFFPMVEPGVS